MGADFVRRITRTQRATAGPTPAGRWMLDDTHEKVHSASIERTRFRSKQSQARTVGRAGERTNHTYPATQPTRGPSTRLARPERHAPHAHCMHNQREHNKDHADVRATQQNAVLAVWVGDAVRLGSRPAMLGVRHASPLDVRAQACDRLVRPCWAFALHRLSTSALRHAIIVLPSESTRGAPCAQSLCARRRRMWYLPGRWPQRRVFRDAPGGPRAAHTHDYRTARCVFHYAMPAHAHMSWHGLEDWNGPCARTARTPLEVAFACLRKGRSRHPCVRA